MVSTTAPRRGKSDELAQRNDIERQRLVLNGQTITTELAVQQAKVQQAQALLALREKQLTALSVRAGIAGVLVDLPHQIGEHVAPGTTLAKVVQLDQLKAALKIPETQARDIQSDQPARSIPIMASMLRQGHSYRPRGTERHRYRRRRAAWAPAARLRDPTCRSTASSISTASGMSSTWGDPPSAMRTQPSACSVSPRTERPLHAFR